MRFLLGLLLLVLVPAWADHTPYLDAAAAVNKAGRQRMLSQFLVKEYLQVATGVDAGMARGHLFEAIAVFDDQLVDLKDFASTPDLREAFAAVDAQWKEFKQIVAGPASRSQAVVLHAAGERLLAAAERNTAAIERHTGRPAGRLVNVAGRQRMLSQRVAKDYLMVVSRVSPDAAQAEMKIAREEFVAGMQELRGNPAGAEAEKLLTEVETSWRELEPLLGRSRAIETERERVIRLTDAILVRMERVTSLVEKR
jgi:nitrate/nitrite-specific signal transduction histidine kinase